MIQRGGYVAAENQLEALDADDLNVATPRRLARNLAALEVHRPQVLAQLVEAGLLAAVQRYPLAVTASGHPVPTRINSEGKAMLLAAGQDPPTAAAAAVTELADPIQRGDALCLADLVDGHVLTALAAAKPTLIVGQQQRIDVVEPDPHRVTVCLMLHDWSQQDGPILDPRFDWYVGRKSLSTYEARLANEPMTMLPQAILGREKRRNAAHEMLVRCRQQIATQQAQWQRRIDRHYADFRCGALTVGQMTRPKVLLVTSRFTTVLQYSTADCEQAFRKLGWRTRKLIEPSGTHRITTRAIAEALATFRPDLVFTIDKLRSHCESAFPEKLPYVCWIQDQLASFTNAQAGASIGPRDFVLSMVGPMYTRRWGYPARQIIPVPKLTRPPARPKAWTSDGDDLVYVSSASQRVETLLESFREHDLMRICAESIVAEYEAGRSLPTLWHVARIVDRVCAKHRCELTAEERSLAINQLMHPLNNALYRQQALRWVGEAADDLGLSFAIYGAGWDGHPDFARFARGPVAYGPELEQLTRRSKINLQIVPSFCLHQRLLDGLVAGGFFLVRQHPSDELLPKLIRQLDPASRTVAEALEAAGDRRGELEEALAEAECFADQGGPIDLVAWLRDCRQSELINDTGEALPHFDEIDFADAAGLRHRIQTYINAEDLRQEVSEAQRLAVEQRLSYTAGMRRMLKRVGRLLTEENRAAAGPSGLMLAD